MTIEEIKSSNVFKDKEIIFDAIYTSDNYDVIDRKIVNLLRDKGVTRDLLIVLYFCLSEAMLNTIVHGNVNEGSIIVGLSSSKIRIIVYDEGDGIYKTFKRRCSTKASKVDVLKEAIKKASTSGDGCGNGLYAWALTSKNLHSYFDITTNDITFIPDLNNYSYLCSHKGTILDLEVPIKTELSWKEILNDSIFYSIEDSYEFLIEGGNDG